MGWIIQRHGALYDKNTASLGFRSRWSQRSARSSCASSRRRPNAAGSRSWAAFPSGLSCWFAAHEGVAKLRLVTGRRQRSRSRRWSHASPRVRRLCAASRLSLDHVVDAEQPDRPPANSYASGRISMRQQRGAYELRPVAGRGNLDAARSDESHGQEAHSERSFAKRCTRGRPSPFSPGAILSRSFASQLREGLPHPRGAFWDGQGTNFSLFSANATKVELCLFDADGQTRARAHRAARIHRRDLAWLPARTSGPGTVYGYRVHGPYEPEHGHRFNPNKLLIDPYAREFVGELKWDHALFGYTIGAEGDDLTFDERDSAPFVPKCVVVDSDFDWTADRPARSCRGIARSSTRRTSAVSRRSIRPCRRSCAARSPASRCPK